MSVSNGFPEPAWLAELKAAAAAAHAFILHLNVRDYAVPGVRVSDYLARKFASRDIVVVYNRAAGLRFALPSMEDKARALLGLDVAAAPDPTLAALGLGGPAGGRPELPTAPDGALPLLDTLLRSDKARTAVVVEWAETIWPATDLATAPAAERTALVRAAEWGTAAEIEAAGNVVILLTGSLTDLHPVLRSAATRYVAVEVPLPDRAARLAFTTWAGQAFPVESDLDAGALATATAGLSLLNIEDVFLQGQRAGRLTWDVVRAAKDRIVAQEYAGLLEILEPRFGFDAVGGMDALKDWLTAEVITPLRQGRTDVPQGLLLIGPPGTGKTFLVRALAQESGFNCVALRMENILGGIVGTSERNLARALAIVRSLAPVVLFVDELDQTDVSSRGQGSGNPVAGNLFNQLLQFLSDRSNQGRVLFVGASNRPDLIDSAFKRFGRVDAIIPVLLPDATERAAVAQAAAVTQGLALADGVVAALLPATERWSCADVAALVAKAGRLAQRAGRTLVAVADAQAALALLRPASPKTADYYTALALQEVTDLEFVPAAYRGLLDDRAALARTVATAPVKRGGRDLF